MNRNSQRQPQLERQFQELVRPTVAAEAAEVETAPAETEEAYSHLAADRHQKVMLELRLASGNAEALSYSYLVKVRFDPSRGIFMDFSGYRLTIAGRNLRPLFEALVRHRVAYIQETEEFQAEARYGTAATVVTRIAVEEAS